jgi:hypothetical protein
LSGEATREAPVRAEPHPTRSIYTVHHFGPQLGRMTGAERIPDQ